MSGEKRAAKSPIQAKTGGGSSGSSSGGRPPPHIVFHSQYIKDVSFENPNPPSAVEKKTGTPNITVNCAVSSKPVDGKSHHYEISLMLSATAKREEKTMFIAEITYGGVMSVEGDIDEKNIHPLVMIEGPRHLFPFARMLMSSIIREGGFVPLNIQPIDFVRLYQARMKHMQDQAVKTAREKKNGKAG
ncbi:MAG: protein-export chaperone SecB [Proteobacteria bacterium]|nr:protein-export chaperone SecB [Pseudomonadota bacterium]